MDGDDLEALQCSWNCSQLVDVTRQSQRAPATAPDGDDDVMSDVADEELLQLDGTADPVEGLSFNFLSFSSFRF